MQIFKASDKKLILDRTYVMGILNVTPDSFSDGGKYLDTEKAVQHGQYMVEWGADIIDIGAQSTRPGYTEISPEEEWDRLEPVLEQLLSTTQSVISVDTYFPYVAKKAIEMGAHIINDVSGFGSDMLEAVKSTDCGIVVMHPKGSENSDILNDIRDFFEMKLQNMMEAGIDKERICFDPGVGFGKTYEENLRIIGNTDKLKVDGCPYLLAASRKRVIGTASGEPDAGDRMAGTIAAHTIGIMGGADIIRVHDIKEAVQAARTADSVKGVI